MYKTHAESDSMYNTPPCYSIYMCKLVLEWLKNEVGGLKAMEKRNVEKAALLYDFLDRSKLFKGCAEKESRSIMNVTFVTGDKDLDAKFVQEAAAAGFVNLKGHRSVGGMRASIYNAMPREGVEKLVQFMENFISPLCSCSSSTSCKNSRLAFTSLKFRFTFTIFEMAGKRYDMRIEIVKMLFNFVFPCRYI